MPGLRRTTDPSAYMSIPDLALRAEREQQENLVVKCPSVRWHLYILRGCQDYAVPLLQSQEARRI